MSIICDSDGFPHKAATSYYNHRGFLQPTFDFSKDHITEDYIKFLKERFFNANNLSGEDNLTEEGGHYSIRPAWDEFTDPPGEAYVMIGNGFDIECGLPTSYSDFLRFLEAIEKRGTDLGFIQMSDRVLRICFLLIPAMISSGNQL